MRYIATLLALALAVVSYQLYLAQVGISKAETRISTMETTHAIALAAAQEKARDAEHKLSTDVAVIRKETNEKVDSLNAQRDALIKRVRRAEANAATALLLPRASENSGDREAASGDTGAELLGSFGAEDVSEAVRADIIREQLKGCYAQYESVRQSISGK